VFGAGVYNTGILAQGTRRGDVWYQYEQAPPALIEKTRRLEAVCEQYDVPLRAAAVQFVRAHPAVASLVIGAESALQLAESIEALQTPIPAAFWSDLRETGIIAADTPTPA
jgi:D-threo-aldose 1-dehydrogenase